MKKSKVNWFKLEKSKFEKSEVNWSKLEKSKYKKSKFKILKWTEYILKNCKLNWNYKKKSRSLQDPRTWQSHVVSEKRIRKDREGRRTGRSSWSSLRLRWGWHPEGLQKRGSSPSQAFYALAALLQRAAAERILRGKCWSYRNVSSEVFTQRPNFFPFRRFRECVYLISSVVMAQLDERKKLVTPRSAIITFYGVLVQNESVSSYVSIEVRI